jgi:anthranilate phosphoribosyltransferase
MAQVLRNLGTPRAFVFCGEGALDEISICGPTRISHLKEGAITTFELTPEALGFARAAPTPSAAARGKRADHPGILTGERAPRDIVLLNAAAAFVAAGLDGDFRAGIDRAAGSIDSGSAAEKLEALIRFSQSCVQSVRSPARS